MSNSIAQVPPGPVQTRNHFNAISLRGLKAEVARVDGFNAKLAVTLTRLVGSMWCAYVFAAMALMSLPAVVSQTGWIPHGTFPSWLTSVGLVSLVAWIAQTFLQLVLLSVIMVGQSVQSAAADARAANTYVDTEWIRNQVNEHTDGGIKTLLDRFDEFEKKLTTTAA